MALARAQYDGLRRNAILALGAGPRPAGAAPCSSGWPQDPSPIVSDAARWALGFFGNLAGA